MTLLLGRERRCITLTQSVAGRSLQHCSKNTRALNSPGKAGAGPALQDTCVLAGCVVLRGDALLFPSLRAGPAVRSGESLAALRRLGRYARAAVVGGLLGGAARYGAWSGATGWALREVLPRYQRRSMAQTQSVAGRSLPSGPEDVRGLDSPGRGELFGTGNGRGFVTRAAVSIGLMGGGLVSELAAGPAAGALRAVALHGRAAASRPRRWWRAARFPRAHRSSSRYLAARPSSRRASRPHLAAREANIEQPGHRPTLDKRHPLRGQRLSGTC